MGALRVQEPGAARAGWELRQRQQAKTVTDPISRRLGMVGAVCFFMVVAFIGAFQNRPLHPIQKQTGEKVTPQGREFLQKERRRFYRRKRR
jgi:hypothetical protein